MTTASGSTVNILQAAKIVENVVGNAWATDAAGTFIYVTPDALRFLGMTLDDLNDPPEEGAFGWKRVIHPEDYDDAAAAWRRCLATGEPYNVEHRMLRANGVYGWGRSTGQPLRDGSGRIAGWYGTVIDGVVPTIPDGQPLQAADAVAQEAAADKPPPLDVIHPYDRPAAEQAMARAFWHGIPQVMSYRRRQPDGSYRWAGLRAEPGYAVSVDVDPMVSAPDERWTTAPSLGETREAVQAAKAVESLFGAAFAFDAFGTFTYATPIAQTSIAFTLEDLNEPLSKEGFLDGGDLGWKRGVHPDDYEGVAASLRHCLRTGEHLHHEWRVLRATGQWVWHRFAVRPTHDAQGRITGWYGVGIDVDVYKKTEEALRERERELSQLVDMVPGHLWRLTPGGEPIFFNKHMSDFLGLTLADMDRPDMSRLEALLETVHSDDAAGFRSALDRSLSGGEPFSIRYRLRRFDGEYRWVETRAAAMRNAEGAIVQWNVICLDIENEVQAQEKLRLAQEKLARASQAASLAELSASIAHEVNQPLAAVVANSHACQRWLDADPPNLERAQKTVGRITRDANAAAGVVNRIRALFRQSAEARAGTSLANVIAEAREVMAEEASRRRIRMDVEIEDGLPLIMLDRVQIQQVLVNLIRNGLDAMHSVPANRVVGVRARRKDDVVQTEISDRGPGIACPDRIFEPFFTTKPDGMGMGLAICRSIVESHGGRLWAEKNEPRGAKFVFALPIEAEAAP